MTSLVGFSTGSLFPSHTAEQALDAFRRRMDLVELSFATPDELLALTPKANLVATFLRVTLHAPFKAIRWNNKSEVGDLLARLDWWGELIPNLSVVFHPDTIDDLTCLNGREFIPCLENMDSRKTRGIRPEEFERWKSEFDGGFVLDAQHAWEHDHSMRLAHELHDCFGSRLSHLHVSGCQGRQGHNLLQHAHNAADILAFLRSLPPTDVALEGPLSSNWDTEVGRELAEVS